ncbi:crotonase/enoyl-CoA hydratase family protein [Paracoccus sp. MC1862]|uniref:crotonase/enoyl-CoA hydratase family protein n=1 Tax=Paracoccus sp. MC1862 TaxID=2760307 RepID=UPI0016030750|nr:crotonase/enoyl-CoA hydratase family protein [Paracoccus sp. MC1862]MBB1496840.1 crotonase/enoyl-CoA hydratase family protein [Paracoccus sp. MC1862]QQO45467.1 crotonase/enoyl-CoA hydratase family protein [Paracoccus sp. MC1862]
METIRIETDARGVATLWLARPDKHNALSAQMIAELTQAAEQLGADPAVRVVVLAAEGKSFCAGGDLGWMQDQMAADAATRRQGAAELALMLNALNELPKPLIGRVHGNAFGGGIGMMSVCDVAVGARTAKFGLTETKLGLIPATIGPYVVARMGEDKARRVFMSGRIFDAAEAEALNLLAYAVDPEDLDAAIEDEVAPYLQTAPKAVAAAKRLTRALGPRIDRGIIDMSVDALIAVWEDDEAPHGIEAFFAKRKPHWQG